MSMHDLVGLGTVTQADDSSSLQVLQVTQGAAGSGFMDRVLDKVRRIFQFGFTSVPPIGSVALLLCRGGDRNNAVVVGTSHQASRPTGLKPGDTAMYDVRGIILKFSATGVEIDCKGYPAAFLNTPELAVDGNLKVGNGASGSVVAAGGETLVFQDGICINIY